MPTPTPVWDSSGFDSPQWALWFFLAGLIVGIMIVGIKLPKPKKMGVGMIPVVLAFIVVISSISGVIFISSHSSTVEAKALPTVVKSTNAPVPTLQIVVEVESEKNNPQECHVSDKYPDDILQWCSLITKYAHTYGLPSNLISAVMLQESGGDYLAYSSSGAVGLMQVMPRDGIAASFECINGPCFASRPTIEELQDPEYNIEYGTKMLAGLLEKYGDIREALKAYGPSDVVYYYADIILTIYDNYK
ncbi:MAG TPA: transglycosylase SLT domain-containing protein [Patescibacteria group bacterium]|nr:transglycosylase SLT domain-containing protein [Patescibacteria group bacterium]